MTIIVTYFNEEPPGAEGGASPSILNESLIFVRTEYRMLLYSSPETEAQTVQYGSVPN